MTQRRENLGTLTEDDFFHVLPYRNFYQYPPMLPEQPHPPVEAFGLDHAPADPRFAIFLSVPFCRVRCHSCPYFSERLPSNVDQESFLDVYLRDIERQIERYGAYRRFGSARCSTVYLGGGTASLLSPTQVSRVVALLKGAFLFEDQAEITLEGNPHEFTRPYLSAVREAGVTRVSLGYQSFEQSVLQITLNSPHTGAESRAALENAVSAGFHTVNVDLLYRLPGQTFEQWQREIDFVRQAAPESITAYEYIVHDRTAAQGLIAKGKLAGQTDRQSAHAWFQWTHERLEACGYQQMSGHAFAKPGHRQRYSDLVYAKGVELIGLGAKAYSYINGIQFAAPSRVGEFRHRMNAGQFPVLDKVSPIPTTRNLMERHVIFSLHRLSEVNADAFRSLFGKELVEEFYDEIALLVENKTIVASSAGIELTELGKRWRSNVLEAFYDPTMKAQSAAPVSGLKTG
jgi:oxygen-independent coproporphyrinogen-3 oxidase